MNFFSGWSSDVAVDLGTANTCVFTKGSIAVNEPSIVAFNTERKKIEAMGSEAREILDHTPANVTPIRPMKRGVIANAEAVEKMLGHFVKKASSRRSLTRPRMIIGVPPGISPVERRALSRSTVSISRDVQMVDETMAAAIGSGLPISDPGGHMIVDIGGGTTDIAVISMATIIYGRSLPVAGDEIDGAITHHLRRAHNLLIGERTAEQIKCEIGSAAPLDAPLTMEVKGRPASGGGPRTITITDEEIRLAIAKPVKQIIQAVCDALENVPPALCANIYDRGMLLTGGGSLLRNLDKRLREETDIPVMMPENPFVSVVLGAGKLLNDGELLKKLASA
jgi:rod shape-determining protein MreB